jgi:hypothetical protein
MVPLEGADRVVYLPPLQDEPQHEIRPLESAKSIQCIEYVDDVFGALGRIRTEELSYWSTWISS